MKIDKDHLYHGAVLNQIAEHERFTAINALKVKGKTSRSAFKVNNDIAVYLKYASAPTKSYDEYVFNFNKAQLSELTVIRGAGDALYLALICVQDGEVCCLPYSDFSRLISRRRQAFGRQEDQYSLLVTLKKNEGFRVYMNAPGVKKTYLSEPLKVRRNACPNSLFR